MAMTHNRKPTHPGILVKSGVIDARAVEINELAQDINMTRTNLSRILNGHGRMTAKTACKLARVLDISPEPLIKGQAVYDQWEALQELKDWTPAKIYTETKSAALA
ncbi:MAG: HigA family addiction module antidote protein [Rhodospirillaceae bacterium]|jgi:antitoxin HigA-1|nr:HigA family addiction module antidote protein [Rhodospirillaceae bacterium]MBT5243152.1 HigA family addiction module antidote protein [Rhodospirillaceae bacterium]MBT5563377.1 HigA family addiction module antidote protein [Rhodospirillaceae bacterium]MBT6243691.1 HigA family addiction module antidote protein [Rhodospirillaceae bacterium]MBT7137008.1 HigA family addiction module antidote protein [Rhodospirillaceae bacterium]